MPRAANKGSAGKVTGKTSGSTPNVLARFSEMEASYKESGTQMKKAFENLGELITEIKGVLQEVGGNGASGTAASGKSPASSGKVGGKSPRSAKPKPVPEFDLPPLEPLAVRLIN